MTNYNLSQFRIRNALAAEISIHSYIDDILQALRTLWGGLSMSCKVLIRRNNISKYINNLYDQMQQNLIKKSQRDESASNTQQYKT